MDVMATSPADLVISYEQKCGVEDDDRFLRVSALIIEVETLHTWAFGFVLGQFLCKAAPTPNHSFHLLEGKEPQFNIRM
jgi:hypothetical protein